MLAGDRTMIDAAACKSCYCYTFRFAFQIQCSFRCGLMFVSVQSEEANATLCFQQPPICIHRLVVQACSQCTTLRVRYPSKA